MDKNQLIDIRSTYCELIRRELLGPGSEVSIPDAEHELITSLPYQRYSVGVLYPQDAFPSEDDGKEDDVATEENDTEAICEAVAIQMTFRRPRNSPKRTSPRILVIQRGMTTIH